MVTIKEIRERIDTYEGSERESVLGGLYQQLSPPSHAQLREFQLGWDRSKSFKEFVVAQNEVLRTCIDLECSEFGNAVREAAGLSPLGMDTDIKVR